MRQFCAIVFIILFFSVSTTNGQVVTITNPANTTPNLAATYGSLAAAITALNSRTAISGPVGITLNTGNPQTAPAGGYVIQFATITNTAASPVTISGSGNTITAFSPQTGGFLYDGIFKLIGADYITIQNFVMQENAGNTVMPSNTNTMTEWGVALLYQSTTDGAQNNTIQNNTISLNRNYQNSFGIYSNVRHSATVVGTTADITNSTTGPNSNNKIYNNTISNVNMGISFIGVSGAANMDVGNDIGGNSAATGNSITNWGGSATTIANFISNSGTFHGIFLNHQVSANVSYNTVTSATISGTTTTLRGIHNRYASGVPTATFTTTISNNTVTLTNNNASGTFEGILNEQLSDASATINITNNKIFNNSWTTVAFTGISNTAACGVINISNNIFRGNTSSATTTGFTAINQSGIVVSTVTINSNSIGDGTGNAISYSSATTGALTGINCSNAGTGAAVSVSNNNFQGFVQSPTGSGAHTYILLTHAPNTATTDNINTNTFTNITANTTGNVRFISRTGAMASGAGATQNCNNNSIVTGFSKPAAGGIVNLYFTGSTCLTGNTMNETGNNFSNITLTGATDMNGWDNEEGTTSGPTKNISNNTFTNWNCGDGAINVIQSDFGGNNTIISGNTISNIATTNSIEGIFYGTSSRLVHTISNNNISLLNGGGTVWGISGGSASAASSVSINGNTIRSIISTGAISALGIRNTAAVTLNISKNKIYDITAQNAACVSSGIEIAGATSNATYNLFNNTIGDIKAPLTNSVTTAVRGINIPTNATTSSINIYYNTVYLNATSSGTNFGTAALYVAVSGTATTGATTLRNNILVDLSTANGTGVAAAYRRASTNLTNYVSTSNNNIFYAGTPSATKLIFYDGTNSDQTLAAFKTRVGPTREANSFTEMPTFLSTSGASANFLHLDPATPTQAESGAVNIFGYTDDYDGNIRQDNAGYSGTGTAPDIGADEIEGIYSETIPPVVNNYTLLSTPICTVGNRTITGVNITDASGIPFAGANVPRIYYRKNAGTWFSQPGFNPTGTATNSNWDFTIVVADMGTLGGGDIVSYYIIAQDLNPIANVASNPSAGLVATSVNAVTTHPTSPNTYVYGYNLSGTYTVGVGGNFTTLTAAVFAYNNACSLAGPTVFELIDNTYGSETFPITINYRADANSTNTLTIRPSSTATPVFSFATAAAPNDQVINLNGARYISIDGRQGGTGTNKSLSITSTGSGVAVQFINDAQNNTIKYCNISAKRVSNFSGTITFLTANTGSGNDNNTIDNNDIFDAAAGFSNNGIYSAGTAGQENDNISVTNNNIYNYFNATNDSHGIYVSTNSSAWTINGNRFYQTSTRVYTSANVFVFGIYVTAGSGYTVSNNIVGYANASGTGTTNMIGNTVTLAGFPGSYTATGTATTLRYAGIGLSLALIGTTSTVDGNTVGGIAMYTASTASTLYGMFGGIYIESGTVNIGTNAANIIGGTTGTNSIYVATTSSTGTFVGIRAACIFNSSIQNNTIGAITVSGTSAANAGLFTGISVGGTCNYTISNNSIGNATADNIQVGIMLSAGSLSNAGALSANNAGVATNVRGINSTATGTTLSITNNTLRGWKLSCTAANNYGIETSGSMVAGTINVNNNFIGTASVNWLNSIVDNTSFFYTINITNTSATTYNIKNNDVTGTFFGTQNSIGGSFLRLTGASSANAISTISGNTFTNLNFKFSTANLFFIYTTYSLAATGQLFITNNSTAGTFNSTGASTYYIIQCQMTSSSGSQASITNNNFSNITTATAFSSDFHGIYTSFGVNPCSLTVSNNTLSNWIFGSGGMTGIDISDMTGTANCSNNTVSNIAGFGDMEGVSFTPAGSSGTFNILNNTISGLVSSGAGGYIYGISGYLPSSGSTLQTSIDKNITNSFSSTSPIGVLTGIFLSSGHASGTVSITKNKIYDLSESATAGHVYGIYNETNLRGNITYTNNYIGDLRAPNSNLATYSIAGIRLYLVAGSEKVYYNTIRLSATGAAANFSTAAVYADAATDVTLRNNIFTNISSHGANGRTVAYWRGDTNLGTYDASSNNNLFYAGTPSARDVIFYDGTNSDQTLAAYQTRVSTRDNLSVSALPNFASTTGSNANFLHIAATANCAVNARGSNSGILVTTDYDNDSRSTIAPFVTDIGADEFSKKNAWTGANGTNWNDNGNWSEGVIPNTDDDNVVITNPPSNQPVIGSGEAYQVASVIIAAGATLTNKGTLKIAGSIYTANTAAINNLQAGIAEGSVEMNGNCAIIQTCTGNVFVSNAVKDFKASNDVTISSVTGEHLNIYGELGFGAVSSKTLTTGDNITLVSNVNGTANVGKILNSNIISGKASVERYINTGTGAGQHAKGWQFLGTPAKGQTIFQSWQESGTTPAGYGTIITGTGSGFDITTSQPSMKTYDATIGTNGDWVGISSTSGVIEDKRGYMIFVRGDRSVTAYNAAANTTNLRIKGTLYQPTDAPPVTNILAGKWASVGNPYASSIDLNYMKNNSLFLNTNNDVVVWDPLLYGAYGYGGYQTLSAANNYEPTAGGTTYYPAGTPSPTVQSGQAFFIHSSGVAGSVTFTELAKDASNRLVNKVTPVDSRQYFRASLFTNTGIVADGNAAVFQNVYSNAIDKDDAIKMNNSGENFGITRESKQLSVEARKQVVITDTIYYTISNLRKHPYQFRFAPKNMQGSGLSAYLIDQYLHTTTQLSISDSSFVTIDINNDPLSYAANRFYVVFKKRLLSPIQNQPTAAMFEKENAITKNEPVINNGSNESSSISIYPNPVENKTIQLHFVQQETGTYRVQLMNNLGQAVYTGNIVINNATCTNLIKADKTMPAGNYVLNIYAANGMKTTLQVIIK